MTNSTNSTSKTRNPNQQQLHTKRTKDLLQQKTHLEAGTVNTYGSDSVGEALEIIPTWTQTCLKHLHENSVLC